jgi:integrase
MRAPWAWQTVTISSSRRVSVAGSIQTTPIKTFRTAWRSLTKAAGLRGLRFRDLRHLAVTELAERGTGEQTIMGISGHVNRKMVEHYSHPRLEAKRQAILSLDIPVLGDGSLQEDVAAITARSTTQNTALAASTNDK